MTLPPCPVCGKVPDVFRVLDEDGIGFVAECECVQLFDGTESALARVWEIYCDDPQAAIDSESEEGGE